MSTEYPKDPWHTPPTSSVPLSYQPGNESHAPGGGPVQPPYSTPAVPPAPPVQRSWWHRLPVPAKAALIGGAALLLCCGGVGTLAAIVGSPDPSSTSSGVVETAGPVVAPEGASSPSAAATPVVETRTVTATQSIPFATKTVSDSSSAKGSTKVKVTGVTGVKTLTYEVTYTNGVETGRKLVREVITQPPVTQVIAVGTKVTQQCDPNYSGACVPIASDVDCAGGSGDGPAYVRGPVRVIGTDIYDLDRDGDGIGCE